MRNKVIAWLAIIALCIGAYSVQPRFFNEVYAVISHGDIGELAAYLQGFGLWTIAIIIFLFIVMTFTIVFPFMILSGAAGIIYGIFWGTMISWSGEVIGAVIMFVFARYFFRSTVAVWLEKSKYLKNADEYSAKNGFKALLVARLLPLAPSGIITAVAAISRISFRDFFWATLVGKLPPVVVKVMLGHDLAYADENMTRLISVILLVVVLYAVLWWRKKRKNKIEV